MVLPWGGASVALAQAVAWVDSHLLLLPLPLPPADLSPADRLLLLRALQALPELLPVKEQPHHHPVEREALAANQHLLQRPLGHL